MKKLILIFFMIILSCNSFAIDYKEYYKMVNEQIKIAKAEVKTIKAKIKSDKNNVGFNKELTYKKLALEQLLQKKDKIKAAEKKYKELVKKNEEFNDQKAELLKIKQESADLDSMVVNLFNH